MNRMVWDFLYVHWIKFVYFSNSVYLVMLVHPSSASVKMVFLQVSKIIVVFGDKGLDDIVECHLFKNKQPQFPMGF